MRLLLLWWLGGVVACSSPVDDWFQQARRDARSEKAEKRKAAGAEIRLRCCLDRIDERACGLFSEVLASNDSHVHAGLFTAPWGPACQARVSTERLLQLPRGDEAFERMRIEQLADRHFDEAILTLFVAAAQDDLRSERNNDIAFAFEALSDDDLVRLADVAVGERRENVRWLILSAILRAARARVDAPIIQHLRRWQDLSPYLTFKLEKVAEAVHASSTQTDEQAIAAIRAGYPSEVRVRQLRRRRAACSTAVEAPPWDPREPYCTTRD